MPAKAHKPTKIGKSHTSPASRRTPWPMFVGGAAVLLLVLGILFVMRPSAPVGTSTNATLAVDAPRLVVDRQQIDFGQVPLDIPVKATFQLSNVGGQPLQIVSQPVVEVKQGC